MYMCTTRTYVYMCTLHTMLIWFAVEVYIDFVLVCRVSMFAADCQPMIGFGGEAEHVPQVCIDFALVCRVSMFAADCATYGGVWGGQRGWLGLIVNFFIIKLPTWLSF
ncbi:LOW QUALITY PROTEIN: hypothetical protein HID58_049382 [Brassica napus]|uniref:Secreted protein n=1 Tax=Brassica napus TaxID=3708 RepID=A0ABQ8B4V2_BRANA|nr:LOW QUALITY PROTEIN: hypothetical protein HID58_049382 [Brassica napus]